MNYIKRQKDMTLKDELPGSEDAQYATAEEQRAITNNSRKKEWAGPKWKRHSVVNVSVDKSKIRCCKEQCCIGTWNIKSVNQSKLEVVTGHGKSMNQHLKNQ